MRMFKFSNKALVPDLPVELERVIHKAMEKERIVRYQHASQMKTDLMRAQHNSFSFIQPLDAKVAAGSGSRELKLASLVAAFLAVVLIVALVWHFDHSVAPTNGPARQTTIAVLPFRNFGSDKDTNFLRLAPPDEIATTLTYMRSLSIR